MNRTISSIFLSALILLLACSLVWAAAPKAVIKVIANSPYEVAGTSKMISSGLRVVGIGETVYLQVKESAGQTITAVTWTLTAPNGSAAVLSSPATDTTNVTPDLAGQFQAKANITTSEGTAEATISIVSAKWVGVGGQWGLPVDFAKGQCALCHFENTQEWAATGHADMFTWAINGDASDHYGQNCISCHVVGYNTAATAVNDGFDDVAAELGWVFPAVLQAGTWEAMVTNQPRLAHVANIQCENCHGPGSLHKGVKAGIDMSLDEGVCGRCHEDGHYHIKNTQWQNSGHSNDMASQATRAGCDACHSGWAFVRRIDPKPIDNRPTNGVGQITCAVCHDPHDAGLDGQIRILDDVTLGNGSVVTYGGTGKLCMQCHHGRREAESYAANPANISSHFGPHGSAQADMIDGSNGIHYGIPVGKSGHIFTTEDACVTCHMAASPAAGQPGHNEIGEHTFSMINEAGVENVAVCQPCHGEIESFEDIPAAHDYDEDGTVESAVAEVEGLMEELAMLLPPAGPTVALTKADYDWTGLTDPFEVEKRQLYLKAAFNYYFVEEDLSGGIHNTAYAVTLLRRSIASLKYGDIGSGVIESITDIPKDQGKKVRIVWSRFAGDGPSDLPIKDYRIWRLVNDPEEIAKLSASGTVYKAMEQVPANAGAGTRVQVEDELWDYVDMVPAAALENYSRVVETLYDSSAVDGMHWSVFVVSGHTELSYWWTVSAPDSGYSIDNLAPMAPMSLKAAQGAQGVNLEWAAPIDADFKYFEIYRGETATFDPDAVGALAKSTDNQFVDAEIQGGKSYTYKVAAYDFSGNRSEFSSVTLAVTGVGTREDQGIPKDFVLNQNYPNPFNPSTHIDFGVPKQQTVQIKIYDLRGALVRTLASGAFSAGNHHVIWDGRDDRGSLVSAGTYLYRLESDGATITKKMIFLK